MNRHQRRANNSNNKRSLNMSEAKRRREAKGPSTPRSWATGKIRIEANDELCFEWTGTRQEALDLCELYLDIVNRTNISAESYASRAAGYLMCFGMPQAGDPDHRPSSPIKVWFPQAIELQRMAVLWLVMREHIPNTGQKIEDVFVGKSLMVAFIGDKAQIIANTEEELKGLPFSGEEYTMTVAELDDHKLNPDDAVGVKMADLCAIMGRPALPEDLPNELVYVPRIPCDAAEADAMLQTLTVFMDTLNPQRGVRDYAGYTNDELMRGRAAVRIR